MSSVGSLIVNIIGDISGLTNALNQAQNNIRSTGEKLSSIGKTLSMAVTLPIIGIGGASLKAAADFEQGMSNVKAVSNATGKEMEQLKSLALKMGADTKYSAKEAALGIEELSKAGLSTKQILDGGLKGALSLAAAGELELGEAAEIASTALNSFKKDNLSVQQAADILAGAANASATSVKEMKFSLSMVSAVSSSVGMSFKDTATAIAVFAQNGLKGSDAGTSLKTMLMNLQPTTDKEAKLFERLGLVTAEGNSKFFDAKGHLKNLADIADILQTSMKGMTDAQRLQAMQTIFGSDAIRASNILFKEGAKGVNDMAAAMSKVGADQVAAEKMNNLNGAIEQLRGSIETAMIQIGTAFLPALHQLADFLTQLTNSFMTLSPETQGWIVIIAGIAAAIGPVLFIIGQLITSFTVISGVIAGISAPVLIAIGVIAAIGITLGALLATNESFRQSFVNAWNTLKNSFIPILQTIYTNLSKVFDDIWQKIKYVYDGIIKPIWQSAWQWLTKIWNENINGLVTQVQGFISRVGEVAMLLWDGFINPIVTALVNTLVPTFRNTFQIIIDVAGSLLEGIAKVVTGIFKSLNGVIDFIVGVFTGNWSRAWEGVKDIFSGIFDALGGIVKAALNVVISLINGAFRGLGNITIPSFIPGIGGKSFSLPQIPMLATGTNYFPSDGLAFLHEGEAVVPKKYNDMGNGRPINIYLDGKRIYEGFDTYAGSRLVALGGG